MTKSIKFLALPWNVKQFFLKFDCLTKEVTLLLQGKNIFLKKFLWTDHHGYNKLSFSCFQLQPWQILGKYSKVITDLRFPNGPAAFWRCSKMALLSAEVLRVDIWERNSWNIRFVSSDSVQPAHVLQNRGEKKSIFDRWKLTENLLKELRHFRLTRNRQGWHISWKNISNIKYNFLFEFSCRLLGSGSNILQLF